MNTNTFIAEFIKKHGVGEVLAVAEGLPCRTREIAFEYIASIESYCGGPQQIAARTLGCSVSRISYVAKMLRDRLGSGR